MTHGGERRIAKASKHAIAESVLDEVERLRGAADGPPPDVTHVPPGDRSPDLARLAAPPERSACRSPSWRGSLSDASASTPTPGRAHRDRALRAAGLAGLAPRAATDELRRFDLALARRSGRLHALPALRPDRARLDALGHDEGVSDAYDLFQQGKQLLRDGHAGAGDGRAREGEATRAGEGVDQGGARASPTTGSPAGRRPRQSSASCSSCRPPMATRTSRSAGRCRSRAAATEAAPFVALARCLRRPSPAARRRRADG